jgi:hypothetical protein
MERSARIAIAAAAITIPVPTVDRIVSRSLLMAAIVVILAAVSRSW